MLVHDQWRKEFAALTTPIQRGENTPRVAMVQEWINLHKWYTPRFNLKIGVDGGTKTGGFGPATESAVKSFQLASKLEATGIVDQLTWSALTAPLQRAFKEIKFESQHTIQDRFIAYLNQFVNEHPVELHPNHGPWVRAFMKGMDWDDAAWCCGSLCTGLDLAAHSMGESMEKYLPWSWSVPKSVNDAKSENFLARYYTPEQVKKNPGLIRHGDLGIVLGPKGPSHIFAVEKMEGTVMHTIEGNSNDEGSRDGYEMCRGRRDAASGKYGIIKLN